MIQELPSLDRSSASFKADLDTFFLTNLPTFSQEVNAEAARLSSIGFGSYSATSSTSLTVGTGSKTLSIETNKGFTLGQPVIVAKTSDPTTYMLGQVTSYNTSTGELILNATATQGSGTNAAWTVSVASVVAGGGVSPDSIVVLTSGTSGTVPAGVTKIKARVQGAGGSGACGSASNQMGGPGASGGYAEKLFTVTPGSSISYAIGSGGASVNGTSLNGNYGGTTQITIGGVTVTCTGGAGGNWNTGSASGGAASNGDVNITGEMGHNAGGASYYRSYQPQGVLGSYGQGGYGVISNQASGAGGAGVIILELYK